MLNWLKMFFGFPLERKEKKIYKKRPLQHPLDDGQEGCIMHATDEECMDSDPLSCRY